METLSSFLFSSARRSGKSSVLRACVIAGILSLATSGLGAAEEHQDLAESTETRRPVTVGGAKPVKPVVPTAKPETISGLQDSLVVAPSAQKARVVFSISEEARQRLERIADEDMGRFLEEQKRKRARQFEGLQREFAGELEAMQRHLEASDSYRQAKREFDQLMKQLEGATDEPAREKIQANLEKLMVSNKQMLEDAFGRAGLTADRMTKRALRYLGKVTLRSIGLGAFVLDAARDAVVPDPGYSPDANTCATPPFAEDSKKESDLFGIAVFLSPSNHCSETDGSIRQQSVSLTPGGGANLTGYHRIPVTVPAGYTRMKVTVTFDHEYSFFALALLGFAHAGGDAFLRIYGWDEGARIAGKTFSLDGYWSLIAWMGATTIEEERSLIQEIPISNNGGEYMIRAGASTWTLTALNGCCVASYGGGVTRVCVELTR